MEVHRELGPGVDEIFYHELLSERLRVAGIEHLCRPRQPLLHRGIVADIFEADLVFPSKLVTELKCLRGTFAPEHYVQLICCLKFWGVSAGFLFDFAKDSLLHRRVNYAPVTGLGFDPQTLLSDAPDLGKDCELATALGCGIARHRPSRLRLPRHLLSRSARRRIQRRRFRLPDSADGRRARASTVAGRHALRLSGGRRTFRHPSAGVAPFDHCGGHRHSSDAPSPAWLAAWTHPELRQNRAGSLLDTAPANQPGQPRPKDLRRTKIEDEIIAQNEPMKFPFPSLSFPNLWETSPR